MHLSSSCDPSSANPYRSEYSVLMHQSYTAREPQSIEQILALTLWISRSGS